MSKRYLPRTWVSPKLVSGQSEIEGTGVFATETIAKGERLMEFGGEMISYQQVESGDYRIPSIWPVDQDTFIALPNSDPHTSLDEYLNHSCDANTWLSDEVTLIARRDIAPGEEITLDQGTWNIEEAYIEDGTPCTCRAAHCRGMLTEEDWKRNDVQERYAGHFHPLVAALMSPRRRHCRG
jgi:SET domain-containing protein